MDKLAEYTRRLLEISARLKKYGEMGSIAQYDMTATAPAGAAARRGKLMAFIRAESRKILLSPQTLETVEFLSQQENFSRLDDRLKGELRQYRRSIDKVTGVPEKLLTELAALTQTTEQMWIHCKHSGEYGELKKNLSRMIALQKEVAACRLEAQGLDKPAHPLDPIIDETDAGMTVAKLTPLFDEIRRRIDIRIAETGCCVRPPPGYVVCFGGMSGRGAAPDCMAAAGKDRVQFTVWRDGKGRASCTYGVNRWDVRFTDHFYENNLLQGTISAMHEGGHGIYEMNVDESLVDMLVGSGSHGAMHESSSRFLGKYRRTQPAVLEFAAPIFSREAGLDGVTPKCSGVQLTGWNRVRSGFMPMN